MRSLSIGLAALVLSAALPACSSVTTARGSSEAGGGACSKLEGKTFASLKELECGLGPSGVSMCNWRIQFSAKGATESRFEWMKSDYGESGRCHCEGNTVTGVSDGPNQKYMGTYNDATGRLTWDGVEYAPKP